MSDAWRDADLTEAASTSMARLIRRGTRSAGAASHAGSTPPQKGHTGSQFGNGDSYVF